MTTAFFDHLRSTCTVTSARWRDSFRLHRAQWQEARARTIQKQVPCVEQLRAEQVNQLYALAPIGLIATVINALLVFVVMTEVLPLRSLIFWLTAVFSVAAARVWLVISFRKAHHGPADSDRWRSRFLGSLAVMGGAWGSIGLLPLSSSIAHQVFLTFVLGGMAAGASSTFSKVRYGYAAFSVPALLPIAVHFSLLNDSFHHVMAAMVLLFLILLGYIARHNYSINLNALLLVFENREMVEGLKKAKESVEELNVQLRQEMAAKEEAEAELMAHHEHLERMVQERTRDLLREIEERKVVENALRDSRERLVLAQKAGRVGVFDWDMTSGKAIWTAELEALFGLQPGEFPGSYEDWSHRVLPDDLVELEDSLRKWTSDRVSDVEFEYRFRRTDGEVRWMSALCHVTYLPDGTPLRMIGTNTDVTEMKEAQAKLVKAKEAAEAGNAAKTEFLANMSHEMRTPLAGVLGMIKLVLDTVDGEEERELLQMAERSGSSLLRIIADVLDFSRLEAGMMRFENRPFSVPDAVAAAVEVVALSAREKGLELSWTIGDGVQEMLEGDAGRVRQVLVNLLGNAVKFTETGSIQVTVSPAPLSENPGTTYVMFSVKDTGIGISDDHLDKIFGKFTQIDSSLTKKHGGTGLGLALSKEIVERMGGGIWAESRLGAGTTFHFTVPARLEDKQ